MAKDQTKAVVTDPVPVPVTIPKPHIEVLERGLQNPFGLPSTPVELLDPQFQTHWCNTGINAGQYAKYLDAGYLPVRPEYLKEPERCPHTVSPDGYVARGARCEEVLMYSLKDHIKKRQWEKAKRNIAAMSADRTKADLVDAAGSKLGAQAAEYLHSHVKPVGTVRDQYERIQRLPEDGTE